MDQVQPQSTNLWLAIISFLHFVLSHI